jgi:predicted unusual protein kinase regulating ubiquinone biosynthesis (AarF/ABC1/UbiB family)/cyclopropane fatty-acyl-phospholipid synthase-like methyltransferase
MQNDIDEGFSVMNPLLYFLCRSWRIMTIFLLKKEEFPLFLRQSLIDLGPVFIKIGQVLSTRHDLLPEAYIAALKSLRDDIPPISSLNMEAFIAANLDLNAFESFDFTPFAAGAVAQVHQGHLKSGAKVAVKIIRPNIQVVIQKNFCFLLRVVRVITFLRPRLRVLNLESIVKNFQQFLEEQVNLDIERGNYQKFRAIDDKDMYIPEVFESLSNEVVLVTELIEAIMPEEYVKLPIAASRLASRIDGLIEKMIFRYGICHADLHPGNFFWNKRGQVVLVDLGLVYCLNQEDRNHIMTFWMAFIDHYYDFAVKYFVKNFTLPMSALIEVNKDEAFKQIFAIIKNRILDTMGKFDFSFFFYEITKILSQYKLMPKSNYFQIILTTIAIDGYAVYLDPAFDTIEATRQKRIQDRAAMLLTVGAEEMLFGSNGFYATPHFQTPNDALPQANQQRTRFILQAVHATPDQILIHLGSGRGNFLAEAALAGITGTGMVLTEPEYQSHREKGIGCIRASWEDLGQKQDNDFPLADALILIEFLRELTTLHELVEGFTELKLQKLFALLHRKMKKGGHLFIQCLHLPVEFLDRPEFQEDFATMYHKFPWLGFITLPLLRQTLAPHFQLIEDWDHSADLEPFYVAVQGNLERLIAQLAGFFLPEVVLHGKDEIEFLRQLSQKKVLQLRRMVWVAQ